MLKWFDDVCNFVHEVGVAVSQIIIIGVLVVAFGVFVAVATGH